MELQARSETVKVYVSIVKREAWLDFCWYDACIRETLFLEV